MKMHLSKYVGIVVVLTVLAAANSRGRPTLSRFAAQGQATLEKGKAIAADSWARHSVSGAEIVQDLADTLADDALQVGRSGGWIVSPRSIQYNPYSDAEHSGWPVATHPTEPRLSPPLDFPITSDFHVWTSVSPRRSIDPSALSPPRREFELRTENELVPRRSAHSAGVQTADSAQEKLGRSQSQKFTRLAKLAKLFRRISHRASSSSEPKPTSELLVKDVLLSSLGRASSRDNPV
ncbi:uncharacterized protein UMAG_03154 [Mycosarcoma maydis]|uniref:Secreted protein n=1 Tax=Mycosarcoma maydis TaxID=5270 RepID=A0A0D1C4P2_MYCMD|nr:uncharacterized protein UMAG_03154 [Ustilago maydis 521]KIS68582.1 hypothetical protein UMAG_03154 [Ustilago maydis 521]|eukprot:XP_011389616.1 hypothetical protein UMAG_03154 [Ustilago maydis 521]